MIEGSETDALLLYFRTCSQLRTSFGGKVNLLSGWILEVDKHVF